MNVLKLVTFDATNTLLRFRKPPWHYYALVASHYGYQCTENELKSRLGDSFKTMWERHPNFGRGFMTWEDWWRKVVKLTYRDVIPADKNTDHIANKLIDDFRTSECWTIADGGVNLLQYLQKQNLSLGVISNFDPRLKDILKEVNLLHYFDFIIASYEVGYSKPDKNIFLTAMEMSGESINPSEALHIGDDLKKDYEGARSAGWHAILVNANINSDTPPAINHVFSDLTHLFSAVKSNKLKL